jgi:hypothetical protein
LTIAIGQVTIAIGQATIAIGLTVCMSLSLSTVSSVTRFIEVAAPLLTS